MLHLVECKKTVTPSAEAVKSFHVLDRLKVNVDQSVVVCFKDKPVSLAKDVTALPISYI